MSAYHHARKMDGSTCGRCETGTIKRVGQDGAKCQNPDCSWNF